MDSFHNDLGPHPPFVHRYSVDPHNMVVYHDQTPGVHFLMLYHECEVRALLGCCNIVLKCPCN